ncbi:hypothetical protein CYLTODRAFT_353639 [Cylindrobasidium torrendii FP15055 ss-10]|uniref:BHLH domain-containing protein n=1 Tax=Cylindrobasidium torrendii FP15055 ss-10 TaxID=1314674 RepID=A0A0D7BAR3_9AGAR|nr:hypothetical protein CYLTODRAFT_353639 [Cylindrobasidium torrendii FP15055 ss-10]
MPPPASTSGHDAVSISASADSSLPVPLVPVTPASIMKLGRLGGTGNNSKAKAPAKSQQTTIAPGPASGLQRSRSTRGGSVSASPALKPIAPAGSSATMTIRPNAAPSAVGPRKTSHKAAEQKRRDSLKTTFDELRGLIPPIPMSTDGRNQDEPVRPGALPPRGPPKTGVEGPNRAVSKLQLLMCGNDFIRQLKGRVERRDDEIGRLRREVERLRNVCMLAAPSALDEGEAIDLSRDLDDVEQLVNGFTRRMGVDDDMDDGDVDD